MCVCLLYKFPSGRTHKNQVTPAISREGDKWLEDKGGKSHFLKLHPLSCVFKPCRNTTYSENKLFKK